MGEIASYNVIVAETKERPMNYVVCPHCKAHRIVTTKMPKDVVVVIPCPACHELVVLFRNKAIGLSRKILEHGTLEQRKAHLANVIAEFLEPEMFSMERGKYSEEGDRLAQKSGDDPAAPISEQEIERFIQVDLKRIDDAAYFKKHFG